MGPWQHVFMPISIVALQDLALTCLALHCHAVHPQSYQHTMLWASGVNGITAPSGRREGP